MGKTLLLASLNTIPVAEAMLGEALVMLLAGIVTLERVSMRLKILAID